MLPEYPPFSKPAADVSPEQPSSNVGPLDRAQKEKSLEKNDGEERGTPIF
jgi:hypothetical protein